MRLFSVLALALAFGTGTAMAACGSTSEDAAPAATSPESGPEMPQDDGGVADAEVAYPAPHAALPTVKTMGGPVLATPKVVPVFFPGFAFRTDLIDFLPKLGKSAYWKAVATEYGVGALTAMTTIDIADAPDAIVTDAEIQAWLISRFDGTHPEFGTTPIAGGIYTLFYPPTTTIYLGNAPTPSDGGVEGGVPEGGTKGPRAQASCKSFGGYHQDVKVGNINVSYAVIPQCATFGPLTGVDVVTGTPSHEIIEAATDPFPIAKPAYTTVDDDHISWTFALGAGEVGDMCAQYDSSFYKDPEIGYVVQRSWSNAAAKAGTEPCVPVPASEVPYFNASPVLPDYITLSVGTTKGITVPVGMSKTIELDLFSSAVMTGPMTVGIQSFGSGGGGGGDGGTAPKPPVSFALDKTTGVNGDKIKVTVTSNAATVSRLGATTFVITATVGTENHYWAGVVGN
jgi:hypothetical protein